jgi:hypothetical protein
MPTTSDLNIVSNLLGKDLVFNLKFRQFKSEVQHLFQAGGKGNSEIQAGFDGSNPLCKGIGEKSIHEVSIPHWPSGSRWFTSGPVSMP